MTKPASADGKLNYNVLFAQRGRHFLGPPHKEYCKPGYKKVFLDVNRPANILQLSTFPDLRVKTVTAYRQCLFAKIFWVLSKKWGIERAQSVLKPYFTFDRILSYIWTQQKIAH